MPARLTRRSFLATATGAALGAACSRPHNRAGAAGSAPDHIVVANHPVYIDAITNRAFTDTTGVTVEYHEEVADDDAWFAAVSSRFERGDAVDRDVVIVSDWIAARMSALDWLTDLPRVTWAMGMVGVACNPTVHVSRFVDLFQEDLHGRVAMPLDFRQSLGVALLTDRVDPATVSYADARATAERLTNSVRIGQVSMVADPVAALLAGDAAAVVARASDCVGQDPALVEFVVPEEGGLLFTDVAVAPVGGANPTGARKYLEFVADPVHAAERYRVLPVMWGPAPETRAETGAETGVQAVLRRVAPEVIDDPRRNPPPDVRARLRPFRMLDGDEEREFRALFDDVVSPTG